MTTTVGSRTRRVLGAVAGCLMLASNVGGQSNQPTVPAGQPVTPGQFVNRIYRDDEGEHKYVVFVPAGYTSAKRWPVIMYLHGACSRGTDGRAQLVSGLAPAIKLRTATYPFLVVFPQCENTQSRLLGGWTDEPTDGERSLRILDTVEREYSVDTRREILMGGCMGGCGVWEIAARTPERWSALVPLAAAGTPEQAAKVANIPVWAFHTTGDPFVPVSVARDMVAAVRAAGGRAFLTEVPRNGHDNSGLTFTQQAMHDWMLDPTKDPQLDLTWEKPAGYTSGIEEEVPFVPGAEVSQAIRLRVCNDVLESLAYALPQLMSTRPMAAHVPGVQRTTKIGFLPVEVALSGLHFQGHLERARLVTQAPDRLLMQLGLRNMTLTVSNSQFNGKLLVSGSAGPMHVVIGHRAPVWLSVAVRPRVENRRLRFEVVGADFQIPPDNWYVTEPGVHVRGMPFLNGRVADGMVEGVYSRKGEIERQVLAMVPRLVQRLETHLDEKFAKPVLVGQIPMPIWQPRLRFWPEQVAIDEHGLTLVMGTTLAVLGHPSREFQVRRYEPTAPNRSVPIKSGTEVALSEQILPAWTELIVAGHVNRFNAMDFNMKEFVTLTDREFLQQAIPDLKRFGGQLEANVEFLLMEPIQLEDIPKPKESSSDDNSQSQTGFALSFPKLRTAISTRQPGERRWTPCVDVDLQVSRDYELQLTRGGFAARGTRLIPTSDLRFEMTGRFAAGYEPQTKEIDLDRLVSQITSARLEAQRHAGGKLVPMKDIALAGVPFRLEGIVREGGYLVFQSRVPAIRMTNDTQEPLTYETRGPFTDWSQPRTLAPGEHHEYRVSYPLTWRRRLPTTSLFYTLPLGREASFRDDPSPGLVLVKDEIEVLEKVSSGETNAAH